jgi:hypothetical protein
VTSPHPGNLVEAVVINWKRPRNVAAIVAALRQQTIPCTITVCDCHDSPEFQLPLDAIPAIDRIYRWTHNLGAFSRYVPVGGYDHKYTFFIDDDMLPGVRCVEHFLAHAEQLRAFGALGQLGRIVDSDGSYRARGIARGPGYTEVDILIRALFVRTDCLIHVPQIRNLLQEFSDPEDDILLSVGLAMYAGLGCYLTPRDADPRTLVNTRELESPYSRSTRPQHHAARSRLLHGAIDLGWRPVRSRGQSELMAIPRPGLVDRKAGVLYLAIGEEYRGLTIASVSSLRRYGYDGPIRVVTDMPDWLPSGLACEIIAVPDASVGLAARSYKTRLFEFAYESTLFLDSDAIPVRNISDIWGYLDDCSIAMVADARPNVGVQLDQTGHHRPRDEYEMMISLGLTSRSFYNSGVILFRRSADIEALFKAWHQEWSRFKKMDQMALVRATALSRTSVQTLPSIWNCPARCFSSIREAQATGVRILHFMGPDRAFMTRELASALSDADRYPPGGDWELLDLRGGGRSRGRAPERRVGGAFLVLTGMGGAGNFEMVTPAARAGLVYYRGNRDKPIDSWGDPVVVGEDWGTVDAASLVQGNAGERGNVDLVIRAGSRLGHCWRGPSPDGQWQGVSWFADGTAGNPSIVQSDYGRIGNFELVVPCMSGGVAHCWRDNDDPGRPWIEGEIFGTELGRVDAVALIQSTLSQDGDLEVIVRVADELAHFHRSPRDRAWRGPEFFFAGATGIPGFIQNSGKNGKPGHFELLTPVQDGGVVNLWRDNSDSSYLWRIGSNIEHLDAPAEAVSALQVRDGNDSSRIDLAAVIRCRNGIKWCLRTGGQAGKWSFTSLQGPA